jgi:glycosyltransferase involved in cell wall biosynthesis
MKIINNDPEAYPEKRNICLFDSTFIKPKGDVFSFGNKLIHKLTGKGYNIFYKGLFYSVIDQKTPCHFFNSINLGKNPWMVTFETIVPRLGTVNRFWYNWGLNQLQKENCKRIIALSHCSYKKQLNYVKLNKPEYLDAIAAKMIVMHPPQEVLIDSFESKKNDESKIVFTLIGSDFFRKGGREVLAVFEKLLPEFSQLELIIISSLDFNDYATRATIDDYNKAVSIINKFPDHIIHYKRLPNSEVLEILKKSDVGLLPTWADTFGYSVLESQAAGCPVISTNIRALPEINNDTIGWIIKVPTNADMDADIDTVEKRAVFSKLLTVELERFIRQIIHCKDDVKVKAEKCLDRIKSEHSIVDHKKKLLELYNSNF